MEQKNLDNSVKIKVRRYLEYTNEEKKIKYQKGKEIVESLSTSIKKEISRCVYGRVIHKIPALSKNFGKDCLESLALKMNEKTYPPEDIILNQEDYNRNIYFITSGSVEISISTNIKPIKILNVNLFILFLIF